MQRYRSTNSGTWYRCHASPFMPVPMTHTSGVPSPVTRSCSSTPFTVATGIGSSSGSVSRSRGPDGARLNLDRQPRLDQARNDQQGVRRIALVREDLLDHGLPGFHELVQVFGAHQERRGLEDVPRAEVHRVKRGDDVPEGLLGLGCDAAVTGQLAGAEDPDLARDRHDLGAGCDADMRVSAQRFTEGLRFPDELNGHAGSFRSA